MQKKLVDKVKSPLSSVYKRVKKILKDSVRFKA